MEAKVSLQIKLRGNLKFSNGMSRQYLEGQLQENRRLERYQLQHRGLSFQQVWLPPTTDRRVNMIGKNQHIYRGQLPTAPLDQLPPEVDPESIDKDKLYEELLNMTFPAVPPPEDYGPTRRVGGDYTRAKRLSFSPVVVRNVEEEHRLQAPILGVDGKIYKGSIRNHLLPRELDPRISGSKRPQMYHIKTDSTYVSPTVVSLHVDGKCYSEQRTEVPVIQVYMSDLKTMVDAAGGNAREMSFVPRSGQENIGTFQNTPDEGSMTDESPETIISEVPDDDAEGTQGGDDEFVGQPIVTNEGDTSATEESGATEESVATEESQEPSADGETTENTTESSAAEEEVSAGSSKEPVSEGESEAEKTPQDPNTETSSDAPVET